MNPMIALKYGVMQDYPGSFYAAAVDDSTGQQFDLRRCNQVPPPHGAAAASQGTTGATTYTYQLTGQIQGKETHGCVAFGVSDGNATLDTTNFVRITAYVDPRLKKVNVYRTVGGATQGKIGQVDCAAVDRVTGKVTFDDTGLAGDSASVPTTNVTNTIETQAGCHRPAVYNAGPNTLLVHLSSARDATAAGAEATRDFAEGWNSTTKFGHIFRVPPGSSPDFPMGNEITFLKCFALDNTGTCEVYVVPGRA